MIIDNKGTKLTCFFIYINTFFNLNILIIIMAKRMTKRMTKKGKKNIYAVIAAKTGNGQNGGSKRRKTMRKMWSY